MCWTKITELAFIGVSVIIGVCLAPAPSKSDLLMILDVDTETAFDAGIGVLQDMDFIPGMSLTAFSTDRDEPLLNNELAPFSNGVKTELSRKRFQPEMTYRLKLSKMDTIYNGHFNNEKPTERVAQMGIILTTHRDIEGDKALLENLRKKKTYVIAIGFQKQEFSTVWSTLASNAEHVMELKSAAYKESLMKKMRILVSQDSKHTCNTDMFRPYGNQWCSDRCVNICLTDIVARQCADNCPYYKEIQNTVNEQPSKPNKMIRIGVPVGIAALVVIVLVILCYCNKTVNLAVRLIYQKGAGLLNESKTPSQTEDIEARTQLESNSDDLREQDQPLDSTEVPLLVLDGEETNMSVFIDTHLRVLDGEMNSIHPNGLEAAVDVAAEQPQSSTSGVEEIGHQ